MKKKAIKLSNAGGVKNHVYTVETGNLTAVLTYILTVCGSKLRSMHGTAQGTTIFNSDDNNKRMLLPRPVIELCNLFSLLILDKIGAVTCITTRDTRGATGGNTGALIICFNFHLPTPHR